MKHTKKTTLIILSSVMLINALSFGIIIPLIYPYTARFGLTPFGFSLLFTSFSFFQFLATPILGKLSDHFGRKPILIISLFGTAVSLSLFGSATSVFMLFLARSLDGITGGNISVAQACISDTLTKEERTKALGIIGASFGFGFLFGPALGGLLSHYGLSAPFYFASFLALLATIFAIIALPETNLRKKSLKINFSKSFHLEGIKLAFQDKFIATVLLITLITSIGHNSYVVGFQGFTVDVLKMTPKEVGFLFSIAGISSIFMQGIGIKYLLKLFKKKRKILLYSLSLSSFFLVFLFFTNTAVEFTWFFLAYAFISIPQNTMITGIISNRSHDEKQGEILGINQSFMSLGQILGPLIAGVISKLSISSIFIFSAIFYCFGVLLVNKLKNR